MLINKIIQSWQLAEKYHRNQTYGKEIPYIYHIGNVYIEAQEASFVELDVDRDLLLISSILHDILEDSDVDEMLIKNTFGNEVLKSVRALTKNSNIDKKYQMADSLERIKKSFKETAMVKLCDRIANLSRSPPASWQREKIISYADEAKLIQSELGYSSDYLSNRLGHQIEWYLGNFAK